MVRNLEKTSGFETVDLKIAADSPMSNADLYYRLNVLTVKLSPLRARKDDVVPLVQHFLVRHGDGNILGISPEVSARLLGSHWPGNVRELENCIRHTLAVADDPWIGVRDLPFELRSKGGTEAAGQTLTYLEEVERRAILDVLESTSGQRVNAVNYWVSVRPPCTASSSSMASRTLRRESPVIRRPSTPPLRPVR